MTWPWFVLVTVYGACMGSFLNVVIYRLPAGKSLWHPPSHCPGCAHRLAWYDNLPVIGWFLLRGKCRYCRQPISLQYPFIEALCCGLFAGFFWLAYHSGWRTDFFYAGLGQTWPALIAYLALLAALLAATVIDARLFIIPLEIPWTATVFALVCLPLGAVWLAGMGNVSPQAGPVTWGPILGALAGLALANALLLLGVLPRSFEDEPTQHADGPPPQPHGLAEAQAENPDSLPDCHPQSDISRPQGETIDSASPPPLHGTPEQWLAHPHPRREVLKECLFLALVIAGAVIGHYVLRNQWPTPPWIAPLWARVLAGVAMGYLVGGGMIWLTRVLGTLAFGKEAMGLGDVHLLAAIGAVVGWEATVLVYFVAPFLGLLYALVAIGASRILRGQVRAIPYGPYLALAAVVVIVFRQPLFDMFGL